MPRRSLFQMIFGTKEQDQTKYKTQLQLLNGYQAQFSNCSKDLYENAQIRACIDAIARNGAKLNPKHIRYDEDGYKQIYGRVHTLISRQPNEVMNAYEFYYKIISLLYLDNNAFVYIMRDKQGLPTGLYPLNSQSYKLYEYNNEIYVRFQFSNGQSYVAPLKDDIIHLKRYFANQDIVGSNNAPIYKIMSIKHIIDEGIVNAIKTTQGIKGILKTTKAMLKQEDIANTRNNFVNDLINSKSGIAGLDATTDFKEVNINPQTASSEQLNEINAQILNYFGISEDILQSKYDENKWNAFYESVIEPIAIQMGLEFTNKIFTYGEKFHRNEIIFESNRLQYASNTTKISIIKEAGALGLLTINECREILNLAPISDGDVRVQSLNYIDKEGNDNE